MMQVQKKQYIRKRKKRDETQVIHVTMGKFVNAYKRTYVVSKLGF